MNLKKYLRFNVVLCLMLISMLAVVFHSSIKTQSNNLDKFSKSSISRESTSASSVIKYPLDFVYPYNYKFILNEADKCINNDVFLVLLIPTRVNEFANRAAIRKTWGNESLVPGVSIVRLFLVGMPTQFTDLLQDSLEEESTSFHDIIQQNFMDTYVNLTIKTMMGLQWVKTFCPKVSYVIKIDSDMFLNTEYLVRFLNPEIPMKENYFTGYVIRGNAPFRDSAWSYYVPYELYKPDYYPPFCGGPGYAFSGDMAKKIYDIAHVIKPFNMEDAFVGVCLEKLGIKISETEKPLFNGHKIEYKKCRFLELITVHHFSPEELLQIWPDFMTAKDTCQSAKDN
ncbi:beta-1,3-galactosyltransferase 2-like [Protopterus annectens]|uniref:beta-1,3-galactosyltransferase 2-like n=1 Tax=Protopterus annectens TaxID=7888 RepID=UPI001CFB8027|nr:beta-1,3-galactosyltransferase 2-like [Protopterus annectens]XP_043940732.1 beta-1,3-galactosyltransferase 2-like [Protopterus annectens]XP_043940733.1 beta-1,3-galactosyltransferase 2-like [Protopterus annectens]